jgi:hypothetical protein
MSSPPPGLKNKVLGKSGKGGNVLVGSGDAVNVDVAVAAPPKVKAELGSNVGREVAVIV